MKFADMHYERPDRKKLSERYEQLLDVMKTAEGKELFLKTFLEFQKISGEVDTMASLCYVCHSVNTKDAFYDAENDYWDRTRPLYDVYQNRLARIAVNCPFRTLLYDEIPETWFLIAECRLRSFSEEIIPLIQQENQLASEYGKLKAGAEIEFEGRTWSLPALAARTQDPDRSVRKGAMDAMLAFYEAHEAEFDEIFDQLVSVRTRMAEKLGYSTFTDLAYQRMCRLDYDRDLAASYRKQVLEDIVPLAADLVKKQAARLGLENISYYDKDAEFSDGNPKPSGTSEDLIAAAVRMYHEMSEETGDFIDLMHQNELWDLLSKPGKQNGGYCTSLVEFRVPFIFANFNGTGDDVNVLTHEAGHAFQYFMSRDIPIADLQWPTMESAEIASMTMEFNAWKWLELFFGQQAEKYRYLHLSQSVKFLPYGVLVDHFQHEIYDHPIWSPSERKACWRRLEKMYLPWKDYSGAPLLERGGWWYRQGHIFENPFYYIDYTLAEACALQFWTRHQKNDPEVWSDYLRLCRAGGTEPFVSLVKAAGLKVPFAEGCLKETAAQIRAWMDHAEAQLF